MAMAMAGRLGAMLVSSGLITEEQLKKALMVQQKEGGRLGSILVKMNFVPEENLMMFLSKQYGVPYVEKAEVGRQAGHPEHSEGSRNRPGLRVDFP